MRLTVLAPLMFATLALAGCNSFFDSTDFSSVQEKMNYSLPSSMVAKMKSRNMEKTAPITIRIFKEEGILEIWKQKRDGSYGELETYEICAWSGKLGPKKKEGDRQAPEGFYPLSKGLMNPYSQYFLAINTGYPNRYDRANQFTGSNLMIHGACSSRGCYSMTDEQILEIFAFARDAFAGGQQAIMLQAYPFRMTAENMVRHRYNDSYPFWQMLKEGYDYFEVTHKVPDVDICGGEYVFNKDPVNGGSVASDRACPVMASNIPTRYMMELAENRSAYQQDFAKALENSDGKVWIDPSESERKALVADLREDPTDALYQPTGPSLEAGRYVTIEEYRVAKYGELEKPEGSDGGIDTTTQTAAIPDVPDIPMSSAVPIPQPSPMAAYAEPPPAAKKDKPFWKFW